MRTLINPSRHPSANARPTIGLLVLGVAGEFGAPFWGGAVDAAAELDLNLICFAGGMLRSPQGFEAQGNVIYDLVSAENVDGLVIWTGILGHHVGSAEMQSFCDRYRPLSVVSIELPLKGIPSLLADFSQGMRDVLAHLIEAHGHRRIAFVSGPSESAPAQQRYQAYATALTEHGLEVDPQLVVPGTFFAPSGAEAVRQLLDERRVEFDALAAANDNMAIDALRALQARGLRVPEDVAVVGIDDIEEASSLTPPLTTAKLPQHEWGRRGVEMLYAQLQGGAVPEQQLQPMRVFVRQSCGCLAPEVAQAGVSDTVGRLGVGNIFRSASRGLAACREAALAEMMQALGTLPPETARKGTEQVWQTFAAEVSGRERKIFVPALVQALQQTEAAGGDPADWQAALSILRRRGLSALAGRPAALARAENLWQQGRVLIATAALQAKAQQRFQAERQNDLVQSVGAMLNTTFDMQALLEAAARELPRLGIPGGYLSLYENPAAPTKDARLILAFSAQARVALEPEGRRFPACQLLPAGVLPRDKVHNLLALPLHFQNEQLGFVVFEVGPRNGKIYEGVSKQLGSALKGALLFRERNRLLEHLLQNARNVDAASNQLALVASQSDEATEQVAITIAQVAQASQQQAASATQIAARVARMAHLIQEVAAGAKAGARSAGEAARMAQSGSANVTANIQSIENIKTKVGLSAERMREMGERSVQIEAIVETIEDIASQTNLLALNAAIEAARAGEQGKGFAVVANEVRKLAEKSAAATKEINSLVKGIQRTVTEAAAAMGDSVTEVERGAALTDQSNQTLLDILAAVAAVKAQVEEIATAAQHMADGVKEIVESVENIASISEENGASTEEVSASAQQMSAQAQEVAASAQHLREMANALQALA